MGRAIKWTAALLVLGTLGVGWSVMTGDDTGDRTIPVVENRKAPNPSVQAAPTEPAEIDEASSSAPSPPALESPEFPQTETGARDAAVAYLEMTEDAVALAPADAAAVQRSIATSDFAEQFGAETEQKMIELTETVPGGVVLRIAPIGVRSVADGEEWLVSVWYAQAITMVGEAVVDDWRTASYRLRWEDGTWKIAAFTSERGPTPGRGTQPASASAVDFEALLDGYTDEELG